MVLGKVYLYIIFISCIFTLNNLYSINQFDNEITDYYEKTIFNYEDELSSIDNEGWDLIGFDYENEQVSSFPSMSQALDLSESLIGFSHIGLISLNYKVLNKSKTINKWIIPQIMLLDFLFFYLPGGYGWLHEEGHRAILNANNIDSINDMNKFPIGEELIYVSHIKDEDLVKLKSESPADMVRLAAAGIEIENEASLRYKKRAFFERSEYAIDRLGAFITFNANQFMYLYMNAYGLLDNMSLEALQSEGSDISKRDSVGLDFTSWVYDLFRPNEAYKERGIHPSGVGIKRNIHTTDLTNEEHDFLKLQANLHIINLFFSGSDILFPDRFHYTTSKGREIQWDMTLSHMLTSFGYSMDLKFFYKSDELNVLTTLRGYFSNDLNLPGIEVELYKFPLRLQEYNFYLTTSVALWLQPKNLLFRDNKFSPGGWFQLKIDFPLFKYTGIYLKSEIKTDGWKSGNEFLKKSFGFNSGVQVRL